MMMIMGAIMMMMVMTLLHCCVVPGHYHDNYHYDDFDYTDNVDDEFITYSLFFYHC